MKEIFINKLNTDSSKTDCCSSDEQNKDCVQPLQPLSIPMAGTVEDDARTSDGSPPLPEQLSQVCFFVMVS